MLRRVVATFPLCRCSIGAGAKAWCATAAGGARKGFSKADMFTTISQGADPVHGTASDAAAGGDGSGSLRPTEAWRNGGGGSGGAAPFDGSVVAVEESPITGVYVVRLNNGPVNTLTLDVMQGLVTVLHWAAGTFADDYRSGGDRPARVRGLVLTSSVKNVFSAGLDLDELLLIGKHAPPALSAIEQEQLKGSGSSTAPHYASFVEYWGTFQQLWLALQGFPSPIFAAVSGDAPAAGCILSLCCDYRVMAVRGADAAAAGGPRNFRIGIGSVRAGFPVPPFVAETLRFAVGSREAERMLCQGLLLPAADAAAIGLVDQLSEDDDHVLVDTLASMEKWLGAIPFEHTQWFIKENSRRPLLEMLETKEKRVADASRFISLLSLPAVHASLVEYRDAISSKTKKTK